MTRTFAASALVLATSITLTRTAAAAEFTYEPPGALAPSSGTGRQDTKVYAPGIRFPIETGPAFANSQVWGHGGGSGPTGTAQCDEENFSYPWRDNYCEERDWDMPLCPAGTGHQGQDIRAADCKKDVHWVVAVTDGTITNVGSYSVYLTAPDGTRYDYLHMSNVQVKEGDEVKRGQQIGKVSNQFGGSATTVHLHFNIKQNVASVGSIFVPGYMSLVESYKTLLNPAPPDAGVTITPPPPPPPSKAAPEPQAPAPPPPADTGCASTPGSIPSGALALALGAVVAAAVRRRRTGSSARS
jgi:MYXO-CTERM domain-containing protein